MDLLIGGQTTASAKFAVLNISPNLPANQIPTASISAGTGITGGAFLTAAGNLATTNKQSLTLGGVDTGNIVISGLATGFVKSTSGVLSSSSTVNLASSDVSGILPTANGGSWWNSSLGAVYTGNSTLDLLIGGTTTSSANLRVTGNSAFAGTTSAASIAAKTSFAGFVVDNTGAGDLFTASKSGATKFTILNNGNIQFAPGQSALSTLTKLGTTAQTFSFPDATGTICLQGSASCGFSTGTNFWTETSNPAGALTTINSTMDLLIGGQTTASAKFAVLNMTGSGTPTASISAGTGITGGAFLTAAGNLATTNKQSLTLGGVDTGNIVISGLATGFVKSTGGVLSSSSTVNLASSDVSGILPTANGGSWWNSSLGAVYTGNSTLDLLIGGTTTSSANLRVTGNSAFAGTTSAASIAARTSFAGFVVDNTGAGDLFTASKSGATKFTILNNGNIQFAGTTSNLLTLAYAGGSNQTITFPAATGTLCLQNSSSCGFALGTNFWTETSNPGGALTTINSTMDLLIGGQTTASAKFAVLNMTGSGTPTASISAGTGITGGAFLTAAGNLATTNKQSLTLGGVDTGNIVISGLATGFVKEYGRRPLLLINS